MRSLRWGALLLAVVLVAACASPGYYFQAARGHLQLMNSRQDIDQYMASPNADPALVEKLELARQMLEFAETDLLLPPEGSYGTVAISGRPAITWMVVAAPELSLEPETWCFPVAGCLPYRGYFQQEDALAFAGKLEQKGLETHVGGSPAYSTLGWFDDPLLDTMLRGSETRLADMLFHELSHQKLYVSNQGQFNESYASFVAHQGTRLWLLSSRGQPAVDRWLEAGSAREQFDDLLRQVRLELERVYNSEGSDADKRERKAQVLADLVVRYREMVDGDWAGRDYFGSWFDPPPNNADFALVGTYSGGFCAFEALWFEAGESMQRFHELAARQGELPDGQLADWLATPCE